MSEILFFLKHFGLTDYVTELARHVQTVPVGALKLEQVKGSFTPKPLTEPYVLLSHHTALVTQRLSGSKTILPMDEKPRIAPGNIPEPITSVIHTIIKRLMLPYRPFK